MSEDETPVADDCLPHHPPCTARISGHLVEPEPPQLLRPVGHEVLGQRNPRCSAGLGQVSLKQSGHRLAAQFDEADVSEAPRESSSFIGFICHRRMLAH
ncbi:hypothetical protein [Streptomyces sp. NPDC048611]|uniref:hypothetical protein n=1 Tax=Streptomyces sp. NPDC048611 TaxID=3155635 RepID=UPI00342A8546